MVQPVVIRAHQHQVGQFGGAAVFPVPDVVGVQTAGGAAARNGAAAVAVLQCAAKPAADQPGRPPGADDLAVAFEPDFAGGVTGQVSAVGRREQRTQMQCSDALLDVQCTTTVVRCPCGRRATSVSHPASTRLMNASVVFGNGGRFPDAPSRIVVVAFPVGDQRVAVGLQCGVERGGLRGGRVIRQLVDSSSVVLVIEAAVRLRLRPGSARIRVGRGSSLTAVRSWLTVALARPAPRNAHRSPSAARAGDDADLIQRQPTRPHALGAAGELRQSVRHRGDRVGVGR